LRVASIVEQSPKHHHKLLPSRVLCPNGEIIGKSLEEEARLVQQRNGFRNMLNRRGDRGQPWGTPFALYLSMPFALYLS